MSRFTAQVDGLVTDDGRTLVAFPAALGAAPPPRVSADGTNKRSEATVRCAEKKRLLGILQQSLAQFQATVSDLPFDEASAKIRAEEERLKRQLEDDLEKFLVEWRARQLAKARGQHEALADAPPVNLLH